MGSEWKEFTLEEIASKEKSALATGPFGSAISSKFFQEDGVPVIRGGNLSADTSNRMSDEGLVFVSKDKAMEFKRSVVKAGDLIFTCWGTINQVGLLDESRKFEQYIISNKQMKVTLDSNKADPLFVYYVFSSPKKQNEILKNGIGAAVPGFNLGQLREHKLWLPSVSEQQKISSFLDCFDKKISLNNQINQTLEQMAQTLFKSWFVDFDPVIDNALDVGNPIPEVFETRVERRKAVRESADFKPLPDDVRQLFPSEFEESELGWVPKGWEGVPLDKIANFQNGLALQKFRPEFEDNDFLPVLKIAQLRQGFTDAKEKARVDIKESCRVYNGDMIFSWSGTLMIDLWAGGDAALNQHLYKVTSKDFPLSFYLYWTKHHLARFQHIAAAKAVTMGHIKKGDLSDSFCLKPHPSLINEFDEFVSGYLKQSINVRLQSRGLEKLRDTLLPKLISGELRLESPEVEQAKALVE